MYELCMSVYCEKKKINAKEWHTVTKPLKIQKKIQYNEDINNQRQRKTSSILIFPCKFRDTFSLNIQFILTGEI
jgi:hypothetical protein